MHGTNLFSSFVLAFWSTIFASYFALNDRDVMMSLKCYTCINLSVYFHFCPVGYELPINKKKTRCGQSGFNTGATILS